MDLHPENQQKELVDFATAMGWQWELFEEKESTRKTRPIKNQIFQEALQKRWDIILVYKLDRWARSLQELINDFSRLQQSKVQFRSLRDNIILDDDPRNMLMVHILGSFAEFEREMIRERTMAGLARARAQGKKLGRPRGSTKAIIKNLAALKELLKQGKSEREISEIMQTSRYRVQEGIKMLNKINNPSNTEGDNSMLASG